MSGDDDGGAMGRYLQHLVKERLRGMMLKELADATGISSPQLSEIRDRGTGAGKLTVKRYASFEKVAVSELTRRAETWAEQHPPPPLELRRAAFRAVLNAIAAARAPRFTERDIGNALNQAMDAGIETLPRPTAERLLERVAEARELLEGVPLDGPTIVEGVMNPFHLGDERDTEPEGSGEYEKRGAVAPPPVSDAAAPAATKAQAPAKTPKSKGR